ncbi:S49 family peptidase [Endozoicomonas montiporae]|uniref:S49 family peptidase n=1 Tax=Endozoicomonas montiporae TaxID=1027273 RepID=UPI00068DE7F4|nr:S49 family peptidase [Endozoicomonas montiporae]
MPKLRAFNWLAAHAWLLDSPVLQDIAAIARREFGSGELDFEALEARSGKQLENSHDVEIRDGVAVIQISGVISRYANLFTLICGGASTGLIAKDLNMALDDPEVTAIVLNIDSPGGEAKGIHELAEMIYQARDRKPIKAYIGGAGASAAYWIATAADEVVMDATAEVGSIGVVTGIRLFKPEEGEERFEIVSSQSPNKRLDPASDEGKADIQSKVDQLADVFIDRVARNMGVTSDQVAAEFGKGGTLIGEAAVSRGMAQRLGSLEGLIDELSGNTLMPKENKPQPLFTVAEGATVQQLVAAITEDQPEVAAALSVAGAEEAKTAGIEEGRKAETERVKSVFEASLPGHEKLVQSLALDGKTTGAEAALKVLQAERMAMGNYLSGREAEAPVVDDVASDDTKSKTTKMNPKELAKAAQELVASEEKAGRKLSIADAVSQISQGVE